MQTKKNRREYARQYYSSDIERSRKNGRERMAKWRAANPEKSREASRRSNNSEGYSVRQARYRNKHPDRKYKSQRSSTLKHRYNLTIEQWDEMFVAQGSVCGNHGCKTNEPGSKSGWHTDHCHSTGKLRSILCKPCNNALGLTKDSPEVLRGLAEYIERHAA